MTTKTIARMEYLHNMRLDQDKDYLQESIRLMSQMVMELEVQEQTGAQKYKRNPGRQTHRNGY